MEDHKLDEIINLLRAGQTNFAMQMMDVKRFLEDINKELKRINSHEDTKMPGD